MVPVAAEIFGIIMRWVHITSAVFLIGGLAYSWIVAAPVLTRLAGDEPAEVLEHLAMRFRPLAYGAIAGLIVSGIYNFVLHPGHTSYFHAWFGLKVLLALHVFAASVLAVKSSSGKPEDEIKRLRRTSGAVISGIVVILIAAYLRRIY